MAVERICEPGFYSSVTKSDERFHCSRSIRDSSQSSSLRISELIGLKSTSGSGR
jgi:hypothetical protein